MSFYLNVRDERPPHAVIGQIAVPYEAAIGEMEYVSFEELQGRTLVRHTLRVHRFVADGHKTWAFCMTREALAELKEKLG